ncbi:MAG: T9SS type A sorting domain-containing protein [Bacteroidota bacterium]
MQRTLRFLSVHALSGMFTFFSLISFSSLTFGQTCDAPDSTWLVTPCYIAGNPLLGNPDNADAAAIVRMPYVPTSSVDDGAKTVLATGEEVGTVWGLAYQRKTQKLFASTLLKRHAGFGPLGPGGIYVMDAFEAEVDLDNSFSLEEYGIDAGSSVITTDQRELPMAASQRNRDPLAFGLVGRVGFGDIDFSEDEEYLWVVNLFDQKLYQIRVGVPYEKPGPEDIKAFDIPGFCSDNSLLAPWGLSVKEGKVYVGVVCPAENSGFSSSLSATVFALDPDNTVWENVIEVDLTYPRGDVERFGFTVTNGEWLPWIETWQEFTANATDLTEFGYPQPILSDIEFDSKGDMILGFLDRAGLQFGFEAFSTIPGDQSLYIGDAAGDILRTCKRDDGTFELENNAAVCNEDGNGLLSFGEFNNQGPGGGEFYSDDFYFDLEFSIIGHDEITLGGLASLPGSDEIATTVYDPLVGVPFSGGVHWYSNTDGSLEESFLVYDETLQGGFGKAAGLGDLELVCSALPVVDPPVEPPVAVDSCPEVNVCLLSDFTSPTSSGNAIFINPSPVSSLISDVAPGSGDVRRFDWVNGGRYVEYEDYAVISGTVASEVLPDAQFEVEFIIADLQDWESWSAKGRGYKADGGSEAAAAANHTNWTFGILDVQSKLIGRGALEGDSLSLTPRPSNLSMGVQIGIGANDKNAENGLSTWFKVKGTIQGAAFAASGDINVDIDTCLTDSVCPPNVQLPQIAQISIVDAASDELLGALSDGDTLFLSSQPKFLNFAVQTEPRIIGSVDISMLALDGQRGNVFKLENKYPYAVLGDRNGDYGTQKLAAGTYSISATPFNARAASGLRGETERISFIVVDDVVETSIVSLFPNPATTEIQIIPNSAGDEVEVLSAQAVYGGAVPVQASFDGSGWYIPVSHLEKGLYLMKLRVGETVVTEKFWVNK